MTTTRTRAGLALSLFAILSLTACAGGTNTVAAPDADQAVAWHVYVQECLADAGYETRLDGDVLLDAVDRVYPTGEAEIEAERVAESAARQACTDEWLAKYPEPVVPIAKDSKD